MTCNNRRQVGGSRCVSGRLWADDVTVCPHGWMEKYIRRRDPCEKATHTFFFERGQWANECLAVESIVMPLHYIIRG